MTDLELVLVGVAATIVGSAFGVGATLVANAFIQDRQHNHEIRLNEQRIGAEAKEKASAAIREMRRQRMQPVLDAMETIERMLAIAIISKAYDRLVSEGHWDAALDKVLGGLAAGIPLDQRAAMMSRLLKRFLGDLDPGDARLALSTDVIVKLHRVGDIELRNKLLLLANGISSDLIPPAEATMQLADAHEQVERYCAGLSQEP